MIIDSHAYCFMPIDSAAGFASVAEHMKWVQAAVAGHHQPILRIPDRTTTDAMALASDDKNALASLPDLDLRADHHEGRVLWTVEGQHHTKYWFPPNLRNLEFTPQSLISEMDYAGVNLALLHTDPSLGRDLAYLAKCVQEYPNRLRCMAPVDEWRIAEQTDDVIHELRLAITEHGLHAIKFNADLAYLHSKSPWDDGPYRPFWEAVESLNVPVFFTLGMGRSNAPVPTGYLQEQAVLIRWMERYPNTTCSLTHGFPWRCLLQDGRIMFPEAIWQPFENPNCHLEVCLPVRLGDLFDFPYRDLWPVLEQMVERIGATQLLWGTDMPFQNRFCTYRQSRDWIEKYCTFLSDEDRRQIMGKTAARILAKSLDGETGTTGDLASG